jgi:hypothetical protein
MHPSYVVRHLQHFLKVSDMYDVRTKYHLFNRIAERLEAVGVRRQDPLISVVENGFEDWYAGRSRT